MLLHNLFENTHIGEADTASVNWHTDSEQQQMDANRRGALQREREPAGSDAIDAQLRARNAQLAQYTQSGKFWLKQKDTQQHIGTTSYTGKAAANAAALELLKQQPELKGNLVITAYGPDEQNNAVVNELTGWTQAPKPAPKRNAKPAAAYKSSDDKRSELQRSKDTGNKNWFSMKEQGVAEGEKVGNMDADAFDAAMSRLKKLAGAGPMKTVWDPTKRVYKNVPTAVQPKK